MSKVQNLTRSARALVIFVLAFGISLFAFPLIAISLFTFPCLPFGGHSVFAGMLENYLFFWPQLLLLSNGVLYEHNGIDRQVQTSMILPIAFWGLVGACYGWLVRNLGLRLRIGLVYPVIAVTAYLALIVLSLYGLSPSLDGP